MEINSLIECLSVMPSSRVNAKEGREEWEEEGGGGFFYASLSLAWSRYPSDFCFLRCVRHGSYPDDDDVICRSVE